MNETDVFTPSQTDSPRILVVEDDVNNRKYYLYVLDRMGHTADEAGSGEDAVARIDENSYDLVLTDLQMYRLGGLEVLHKAKAKDPNTQVIIMTGYGSIPTAVKAMQQGAFDYLSKPINKDDFVLRVEKALEHGRMLRKLDEQQNRLEQQNRHIQRDLDLAKAVQNSMTPSSFSNEHVAVGIEFHPIIGIGGDFCSIHHNNSGRMLLNMIDVTGHGIAAALLVNRVNNEMRDILKMEPQPKEILSRLNSFFYDTFGNMGLFMTMISLQLDFAAKTLTFAGGAHPAALLFHPNNGLSEQLVSQNSIIGFQKSEQVDFVQNSRPLERGDRIVICTDGILEAEDEYKSEFGFEGLSNSLRAHGQKTVTTAANEIIHDVRRFSAGVLRDDILLVIIEIR